ncbi:MAG TPA: hypothetical protein VMY98_02290 [Anaerolineae bacterium]|nr:hypothetical protein [Anaerolineae bacterium]
MSEQKKRRRLTGARVVIDLYPPKFQSAHPDKYYNEVSPLDGNQTRSRAEMDIAELEAKLPGVVWGLLGYDGGGWLIYTEREREDEQARGSAAPPASP